VWIARCEHARGIFPPRECFPGPPLIIRTADQIERNSQLNWIWKCIIAISHLHPPRFFQTPPSMGKNRRHHTSALGQIYGIARYVDKWGRTMTPRPTWAPSSSDFIFVQPARLPVPGALSFVLLFQQGGGGASPVAAVCGSLLAPPLTPPITTFLADAIQTVVFDLGSG
jgi:hypothetical protein